MPPPSCAIATLLRLEASALKHCDFSFDVDMVAVPPFSGDDIGATVAVASYRKDYNGARLRAGQP